MSSRKKCSFVRQVTFYRHCRMAYKVGSRPSLARNMSLCAGPWCTELRETMSQASATGVWALVRAAKESHAASTAWRVFMDGTCCTRAPSSVGTMSMV